ncbi:MAG: hypothetical protein DRP71_04840 [Verrucomicrobia bacterium]|nr:MAG: hypothetical protein DRP71_04840 [Verrucomicrobiota bacterium]
MESHPRDDLRREVRSSVHRICLKRDAAETALNGLPEAQIEEALVSAGASADDEEARRWYEEDLADFSRAHLISELVTRRIGETSKRAKPSRRTRSATSTGSKPASRKGTASVADLLDGMLAQQKKD